MSNSNSVYDIITNPSTRTIAERAKLQHGMDDFTSFSWAGVDMWGSFGAFIINEKKGSLKIYNGASYTNNFAKQQFMDGYTNISGVTFDTQKISFTIGVYWISIEDYRLLINLLHPYEVNDLAFGFDNQYCYQCKLEAIKDSTRHVVGKENNTSNDENNNLKYSNLIGSNQDGYRYYTELNLTFDVIGANCAVSREVYYINFATSNYQEWTATINAIGEEENKIIISSDLDYPFTIDIDNFIPIAGSTIIGNISVIMKTNNNENVILETHNLFDIRFKNTGDEPENINLTYNSEHGLLMLTSGDKSQILTLLTTFSNGKRIVDSFSVNKLFIPGRFSFPPDEDEELKYVCDIQMIPPSNNIEIGFEGLTTVVARYRTRTNVI